MVRKPSAIFPLTGCELIVHRLDIIRSTTSDRFLTFTSPDLKKVFGRYQSAQVREWGNEAFACPIDLLEYIVDITMLYKMQPRGQVFSSSALEKARLLHRRVSEWKPRSGYSEQMSYVVTVWHAGILLYVIRMFRLHQHGDSTIETARLVECVFRQSQAVQMPSAWSHALIWPLFQAGLWLEGQDYRERRQWVTQFLQTMVRASGCNQLDLAADTLEMVWNSSEYHDSITAGAFTGSLVLG